MSCYARDMNRVIDAAQGLTIEWATDTFVSTGLPDAFEVITEDTRMTYADGACTAISGTPIDVSRVATWDARARQLVTHVFEDGEWRLPPPPKPSSAPASTSGAGRPNVQSIEHHQRVADAFARDGYQGVMDEFGVARRQASRYISRAREAGLIAPSDRV